MNQMRVSKVSVQVLELAARPEMATRPHSLPWMAERGFTMRDELVILAATMHRNVRWASLSESSGPAGAAKTGG